MTTNPPEDNLERVSVHSEIDLCDCPIKGESDPEAERCMAEGVFRSRHGDGETYAQHCTRPEGHDGPHSACSVSKHPAEIWGGGN